MIGKFIFAQGIQARSFRTHGDLSLDKSLVFDELWLASSHIGGTIFASDSLINKLRLLDAEVQGSLLFRRTMFLEPAILDTVPLSGELSMRECEAHAGPLHPSRRSRRRDVVYRQNRHS